jgi:hypothetical protein
VIVVVTRVILLHVGILSLGKRVFSGSLGPAARVGVEISRHANTVHSEEQRRAVPTADLESPGVTRCLRCHLFLPAGAAARSQHRCGSFVSRAEQIARARASFVGASLQTQSQQTANMTTDVPDAASSFASSSLLPLSAGPTMTAVDMARVTGCALCACGGTCDLGESECPLCLAMSRPPAPRRRRTPTPKNVASEPSIGEAEGNPPAAAVPVGDSPSVPAFASASVAPAVQGCCCPVNGCGYAPAARVGVDLPPRQHGALRRATPCGAYSGS